MLSPENSPPGSDTGRCERQGDLEVTRSIVERSPVPHQSREPGSREKLQAPWVSERALRTFLGSLVCM